MTVKTSLLRLVIGFAVAVVMSPVFAAQSPVTPAFEAASIKLSQANSGMGTMPASPDRYGRQNASLREPRSTAGANAQPLIDSQGRPICGKQMMAMPSPDFAFDPSSGGALSPGAPNPAASVFTAVSELGLRLEKAAAPVDVIVIDHAERPTEN